MKWILCTSSTTEDRRSKHSEQRTRSNKRASFMQGVFFLVRTSHLIVSLVSSVEWNRTREMREEEIRDQIRLRDRDLSSNEYVPIILKFPRHVFIADVADTRARKF